MTYTPKVWADHPEGGTVIDAASLNRLENAMAAVHTVADAAATDIDLTAVNTQAVETATAVEALAARVAALEDARSSMVAVDEFQWVQTVQTNATLNAVEHVAGDGSAGTISGYSVLAAADAKAIFIHCLVHNNYASGTSTRRRFQLWAQGEDSWEVTGAKMIGGVDAQTGDRHSIDAIGTPGGLYYLTAYMGNSATVTVRMRILAVK